MIDDDLVKIILAGVHENNSLQTLNFSHNRLTNVGARRISKVLLKKSNILYINISNNQIGYEGSRYLAQTLKKNTTVLGLDLKLNFFNDKAACKFFKDISKNKTLMELDLSANLIGDGVRIFWNIFLPNQCRQLRKSVNTWRTTAV